MSFGNLKGFSVIQEFLILVLMLVNIVVLIYVDMDFIYKVGIVVFSVLIIFLSSLATSILKLQKDLRERQLKQA
ncbi:MAG: hypothetical protein LBH74_03520 [Nitrososphaerota archaeon]|uniref:hypothetical protein n=1 Tax=Candidatus Bathycorpusculum sp. TaxID=2994959 RepID=UPI0028218BA0|nr:hypothetical protein [Candidatus Termitimicrobium sp.]MCL2432362.1 hypothetical protein [Candidatus Termitimicrobium sp.]MDR0492692.1 hypothetical protein [Nitrososphaerota archaeon]